MVVMVLEKAPPGLRGALSRWLVQIQQGVYVGKLSRRVRDLLWERCIAEIRDGRCCQAWTMKSEQGFCVRTHGDGNRKPIDFEGLTLMSRVHRPRRLSGKKLETSG